MASRDGKCEKEKSFPERFKKFLKSDMRNRELPEIKINDALYYRLNSTSSLETRIKAVKDLYEAIQNKRLSDECITQVWMLIKDLLNAEYPSEVRHNVLDLFCIISVTSDCLGNNRTLFFNHIVDNYLQEDTLPMFKFFQCIVSDGRRIQNIEHEIGAFLVKWLPVLFSQTCLTIPLIEFVTNIFKFNAVLIDESDFRHITMFMISRIQQSNCREELEAHIVFIETLIAYAYIPEGTLTFFVSNLAKVVSIPFMVQNVWKVMRNLLRTELGVCVIYSLLDLISTSENFHVVRGSIFFVSCAMWSKQKITSLALTPMEVLPALQKRAEIADEVLVVYEITISISKLLKVQSDDIHFLSWNRIFVILEKLLAFAVNYQNKEQGKTICLTLNEILDDIEILIEEKKFHGDVSSYFDIVDAYSKQRSIESVYKAIDHKIRALNPYNSQWLLDLTSLVHRHFKLDHRPPIRLHTLSQLRYIFDKYRGMDHCENICKTVVLGQLNEIGNNSELIKLRESFGNSSVFKTEIEEDMLVRKGAVSLLIHMILTLQSPVVEVLLKFVEKIVFSPYELDNFGHFRYFTDEETEDIYKAVKGLTLIFKKKIWQLPSSYAIYTYQILMGALEQHYRQPEVLEKALKIRKEIFEMIFELRADGDFHLGLPNCPEAINPLFDTDKSLPYISNYTPYIVLDCLYDQNDQFLSCSDAKETVVRFESKDFTVGNTDSDRRKGGVVGKTDLRKVESEIVGNSKVETVDGETELEKSDEWKTDLKNFAVSRHKETSSSKAKLERTAKIKENDNTNVGDVKFNQTDSTNVDLQNLDKSQSNESRSVVQSNGQGEDIIDGGFVSKQVVCGTAVAVEATLSMNKLSNGNVDPNDEKYFTKSSVVKNILKSSSRKSLNKNDSFTFSSGSSVSDSVMDGSDNTYFGASDSEHSPANKTKSGPGSPVNNLKYEGLGDLKFEDEPPIVITHISLTKAAIIVIVAMKKETDWPLLKYFLDGVPQVLQNKALIISRDGRNIDYLATTLCSLIEEEKLPDSLKNTPPKFSKSDFDGHLYPVLGTLACYHKYLKPLYQFNIIQCLQNGMTSIKFTPHCVRALTLCLLEMRSTMCKNLRNVIIQLSKISATVQNAQPTLEFLSTLLHIPSAYVDFVQKQYLTVFAITTPYTNPFKFNHYIVTLAYHVICMWFMKCRVQHRRDFVHFIANNLNMVLINAEKTPDAKHVDMIRFHKDLRETCVDFMARNCFDSFAPETIRSPVSKMLFDEGQVQTWLVGTRIISVTTSGCSKKPIKNGLCHKCLQLCISNSIAVEREETSEPQPSEGSPSASVRRRHKSDFVSSPSSDKSPKLQKDGLQSKDDMHMETSIKYYEPTELAVDKMSSNKIGICSCWCTRWCEITIRQPTGNISYGMRVLNPQRHVVKEEIVPVQDLSSFYYSFCNEDSVNLQRFLDNRFDLEYEKIRTRASSADSNMTNTGPSVTPSLTGDGEWSRADSDLVPTTACYASSDPRLDYSEDKDCLRGRKNAPVHHCFSNPEVSKIMSEAPNNFDLNSEAFEKCSFGEIYSECLVHKNYSENSTTCMDSKNSLYNSQDSRNEYVNSPTPSESTNSRNSVKRCSSMVGTHGSNYNPNRVRHTSAFHYSAGASIEDGDHDLEPVSRGRVHTISEINPASRKKAQKSVVERRRPTLSHFESNLSTERIHSSSLTGEEFMKSSTATAPVTKEKKGGVSPSSVFLQLYYQGCFGSGCFRPILLPTHQNKDIERAIKMIDLIKPHEHHRIGLFYVGPDQLTEAEIFSNTYGSQRYHQFLDGIGNVYHINDFTEHANLGRLDRRGSDGKLIHMWQDELMQVVFHVATSMPNRESDPSGKCKKRHIGNDYATIVYNNSGFSYNVTTVKTQLNHAIIEIVPGDHDTNLVKLRTTKESFAEFMSWENSEIRFVSDTSLPLLVRQLALHANLASIVWESLHGSQSRPYATSWMERLRKMRKLRETVLGKTKSQKHINEMLHHQHSISDSNDLSYLDFSDMIEADKPNEKTFKDRSRTAGFLDKR